MNAGAFDKRIVIEQRADTRDGMNQRIDSWAPVATPWARIEPISGREFVSRSGEAATATHRITCWWIAGVNPLHRVAYAGRIFNVLHVSSPQGRERELEMICEERVA